MLYRVITGSVSNVDTNIDGVPAFADENLKINNYTCNLVIKEASLIIKILSMEAFLFV